MTTDNTPDDPIAAHRGRLMGLAYRMLGSIADAEDVLQDAYLRYAGADRSDIRSTEAFLVTVVTRLCLDRLKSARAKRESYVGPWLPEPAPDADALSPHTALELAEDLSFALLLTLERLSGPERAAFLLHDVFDTPFADIAAALGKSEAACRQLATRARKAVRQERAGRSSSPPQHRELLQRFIEASASGDAERLQSLLTDDVVVYADGGGVKLSALHPIFGDKNAARFFTGLVRKGAARGEEFSLQPTTLNGMPGLLLFVNGVLDQTVSIDVSKDRIAAIYVVRNPDKLKAVSPQSLN